MTNQNIITIVAMAIVSAVIGYFMAVFLTSWIKNAKGNGIEKFIKQAGSLIFTTGAGYIFSTFGNLIDGIENCYKNASIAIYFVALFVTFVWINKNISKLIAERTSEFKEIEKLIKSKKIGMLKYNDKKFYIDDSMLNAIKETNQKLIELKMQTERNPSCKNTRNILHLYLEYIAEVIIKVFFSTYDAYMDIYIIEGRKISKEPIRNVCLQGNCKKININKSDIKKILNTGEMLIEYKKGSDNIDFVNLIIPIKIEESCQYVMVMRVDNSEKYEKLICAMKFLNIESVIEISIGKFLSGVIPNYVCSGCGECNTILSQSNSLNVTYMNSYIGLE